MTIVHPKNTPSLKIRLKNMIMISLDVTSLYPSIDAEEMANSSIKRKTDKENNYHNIKTTLQSATNLVLRTNFFKFINHIYKQLKGVLIGSPTS